MRNQLLTLIGCLAFTASGGWMDSGSLAAQTRATTSDIPWTRSGRSGECLSRFTPTECRNTSIRYTAAKAE